MADRQMSMSEITGTTVRSFDAMLGQRSVILVTVDGRSSYDRSGRSLPGPQLDRYRRCLSSSLVLVSTTSTTGSIARSILVEPPGQDFLTIAGMSRRGRG